MGCSGIDVDEIYQEAQKTAFSLTIFDSEFNHLLSYSIEDLDKEMEDCQKKINKLSRMSSSNALKSIKISTSLSYLQVKVSKIRMAKKNKIFQEEQKKIQQERIEIVKREIEKQEEMIRRITYLCQLFPKNYFLNDTKRDEFIPSNWRNLPINVLGKYDDGNNLWLDIDSEWKKAFHGTGRHCNSDEEIRDMIDSIIKFGFKNGNNNNHSECTDILHPGNKIGKGVYVSPNIETAKYYSGTIVIKGKKYLTLFLVKVKKDAIRKCNCPNASDYWVLRGTNQEIRPVSVLLSEL